MTEKQRQSAHYRKLQEFRDKQFLREQQRKAEVLKLNHLPVNQLAKKHLIEVGEDPWPEHWLHVYHLMWWALEKDGMRVQVGTSTSQQSTNHLIDYLEHVMWDASPKKSMNMLVETLPGLDEPMIDIEGMQMQESPRQAAEYLVDALHAARLELSDPESTE